MSFLTLDERKKLEELLKMGLSFDIIAKEMKRPSSTLTYEVRRARQKTKNPIYNAEESHRSTQMKRSKKMMIQARLQSNSEKIIQMWNENKSSRDIADYFDVNQTSVLRWFRDQDISTARVKKVEVTHGIAELEQRICSLEMQIKILINQIKELKNDKIT